MAEFLPGIAPLSLTASRLEYVWLTVGVQASFHPDEWLKRFKSFAANSCGEEGVSGEQRSSGHNYAGLGSREAYPQSGSSPLE